MQISMWDKSQRGPWECVARELTYTYMEGIHCSCFSGGI